MRRGTSLWLSLFLFLFLVSSAFAATRFRDNGDQTVTDTQTGLIWSKDANLAVWPMSWQGCLDFVDQLNAANGGRGFLGFNDWRDPTSAELMTLVDPARTFPALTPGHPFLNVQSEEYWSSSSPINSGYLYAYGVNMGTGQVYSGHKPNDGFVWPVRGTQTTGLNSALTLSPASLDFGTVALNGAAASQTLTLTSSGSAPLVVSGVTLTGTDAPLFSVTAGSCPSLTPTLAPGTSCTLNLGFTTPAAGAKSATLNVASSDPVSPRSATLRGAGADTSAPVITGFAVPATSSSLTVAITELSATDNVGVTGYCVTEAADAAGCSWNSGAPAQYSFASATPADRTLRAFAKDAAGNLSQGISAGVTLDGSALPRLSLSTLSDGASTANELLNVAGRATDSAGLAVPSLTVAGVPVSVGGDGSFSHPVLLQAGTTAVTVTATDAAGNRSAETRRITLASDLPSLAILSPADNSTTAQGFVAVSGTVAPPVAQVSVAVNGGAAELAALDGSSFTATVNLAVGLNTIETTVTDLSGKKNAVKRSVLSDSQGPTLSIGSPVQDLKTSQATQTISGSAADLIPPATVSVSDGSTSYTPELAGGSFSQDLTFGASKTYPLVVTLTEGNGRRTEVRRNIVYRRLGTGGRFEDNGDQTVTDTLTGLTWVKDANLPGMQYSWSWGLDYAASMNGANGGAGTFGYNDWRLPTVDEMQTLVDTTQSYPALPAGHPFLNVQSAVYWSGVASPGDFHYIYGMDFGLGIPTGEHSYNFGFIWPVRGERVFPALPATLTGASYSQTLAASWGVAPYSWALTTGVLPSGITLNGATGALTGSATRSGVYSFTVQVTDSRGLDQVQHLALSVTDNACVNTPARIAAASYPDLRGAYLKAVEGDLIQLQGLDFYGDLSFDRPLSVKLSGGYDCGYTANAGSAGIVGILRVLAGTVDLGNLRFK